MDASSKAVLNFSCDLLKEIVKVEEKNKNIFYSPLSISAVLKMVMFGASGNTKSQMEKVLHVSEECSSSTKACEEGLPSSIKELLSNQTGKKYELNIVNGVFGEQTFPFLEPFVQHVKNDFSAEVQPVDFLNNAVAVTQKINEWVKCHTKGKIPKLFEENSLDSSSCVALVNAIYFKGQWAKKFNPENTREEAFHLNKNEKKTVQMMSMSGTFKLSSLPNIKSKVLVLPYEDDICMIVVLPDEIDGINELISKTHSELLTSLAEAKNLKETEADVMMPKFKMEESYQLVPMLKEMGMTDLFGPTANLSGISEKKGLFVSSAAHKSMIEVNEEGTEAAAATGVGISVTSIVTAPLREQYVADHPFLFFLVNCTSMLILFQGVLFSP